MKKNQHAEEQIIGILKLHEADLKTADLCREHGISAAKFSGWKLKFGCMDVSEAQRLKATEDEDRRLTPIVAELSLHGEALKTLIRKTDEACQSKTGDVAFVSADFRLSERRACKLLCVERSSYRCEPRPDHDAELRE
jgi:putative transposase